MQKILLFVLLLVLSYLFFQNSNFLQICAGIAIFIFGMLIMGEGFKSFSGGILERILKRYTNKTYKSILFGTVTTTLMQSSTLISLLSISFLSAGLINLVQGIGILFGSQIGTTTGAWLIAGLGLKISISKYAMPIIVFGVIFLIQKQATLKGIGKVFIGIGFLFLGVDYIKVGFEALGDNFDLSRYSVDGIWGVLIFFAIGTVLTIVTQSSLATIVLTITAVSMEQISYPNALGIVLGANLGTTFTALISSLGANINGKRLSIIYLIFNIFICSLSVIFLNQLMQLVDLFASLLGISLQNYGLKLAIFHSTINILGVVMLTPFIENIATLVEKFVKARVKKEDLPEDVKFISNSALEYVNAARETAHKEICNMYQNASEIMCYGIYIKPNDLNSNLTPKEILLSRVKVTEFNFDEMYTKKVKTIYGKIVNFIVLAQSKFESAEDVKDLSDLQKSSQYIIEALKCIKHMQKNLNKYLNSQNGDIKDGYNEIRENLIEQLRIFNQIFSTEEEDLILVLLSKVEILAEKFEVSITKTINQLIRTNKITPLMGTSFMNDTAYVYDLSENLIKAARLMYIHKGGEQKEMKKEILLGKEEVQELVSA
ncbi:MAG: Na/Pi cotransporter family protein [Campylobacteraceae bacterium]